MSTSELNRRQKFIETLLSSNGGTWPDLEGLIRDIYVGYIQDGDVVLDIGVNHGTHLFQLAEAVGPTGRVVGIEPVPAHLASIRHSTDTYYPHLTSRIEIRPFAVGRTAGSAEFFVSKINDGGLSGLRFREVLSDTEVEKIQVEVKTIDELIEDLSAVHFVKIDVEGGEFDALAGAPRLLAQRPVIVFEFDETAPASFNYRPQEFLDLFKHNGMSVFDIFGFPIENGDEFLNARVWNFVSAPDEADVWAITAPARRTLNAQFPQLAELAV
jgi:FkbM family methyltransferase